MIYLMSKKFFEKNVKKIIREDEYFGLDGDNYAVTSGISRKEAIASKYNRFQSVGGFCPETKLYKYLKRKKDGEPVPTEKYEKELKAFLKDKSFIAAVRTAFKASLATYPHPINILIVLPNIVWKFIGKDIQNRMYKLSKVDFEFIFTQTDIEESKFKILRNHMSEKEMKMIAKSIKHLENKYDLKFSNELYDEE